MRRTSEMPCGVRDVRLGYGDSAGQHVMEVPAGVQSFAQCQRHRGDADELRQVARVFRKDGLLDEEGVQGLKQWQDPLRRGGGHPAVEVDGHVAVVAEYLADGGDPVHDGPALRERVDGP